MADLPRFYEPSLKGTPPGCVLGVNVFELSVGGGGPRSLQSSSPSRAIVGFPPWPVSDSPAPKAFSWSEVKVKVAQSCPALCDPTDYTVHGILQARILEWVAFSSSRDLPNPGIKPRSPTLQRILYLLSHQGSPRLLEWVAFPFSRGSSYPRDQTQVSHIAGGFFTSWATREAQEYWSG